MVKCYYRVYKSESPNENTFIQIVFHPKAGVKEFIDEQVKKHKLKSCSLVFTGILNEVSASEIAKLDMKRMTAEKAGDKAVAEELLRHISGILAALSQAFTDGEKTGKSAN